MKTLKIIGKSLLLTISVVCFIISPAAFTPAVYLSFAFMLIAGVMGYYGDIKFSISILCLSSIAIALSPITELMFESKTTIIVASTTIIIGYVGLMLGVIKLKQHGSIT